MKTTPGLRERKNAAAKASIYRAAMDLFSVQGYDETTVEQIAERAGVSRATFFNYFGAKEGVLRFYGQQLQSQVEQLVTSGGATASPLQRFRQILDAMAGQTMARRAELKLVYRFSLRDPDYPGMTPARERIWQLGTDLIAAAQEAGEVRKDMPARQIAFHIFALVQNAILAHIYTEEPLQPLVDSAWRLLVGGIHDANSVAESN